MLKLLSFCASFLPMVGLSQQWYAGHFSGWAVPTIENSQDVAELPIPIPGANIRTVSTLTTTNTPALLGDLTGKTITATTWLECSNAPIFYGGGSGCGNNGSVPNMRLFISSDQRPYTEIRGLQNPTAFWWCRASSGVATITCETNVLQYRVSPEGWSDALGHLASDPNYTPAFQSTVQNVAQVGLSFGCYYFDTGVGIINEGASATLDVLRYEAKSDSVVTVQIVSSGALDGPWNPVSQPTTLTNPPMFFKTLISQ